MAIFSGCIHSKTMKLDTWVKVVTPNEIKKDDKPYRVIYMLHGSPCNSIDWIRYTMLPLYACKHNVVFVIPEIGNVWSKSIPDGGNFFDYIVDELPDIIGGMFNISDKRGDMAIMGNSTGAYSALKCAFLRPKQYVLCGAFSTGHVRPDKYVDYLQSQDPGTPEDAENLHLKPVYKHDLDNDNDALLKLAVKASKEAVKPKIYMTIGKQDFLYESNEVLKKHIEKLTFDYTFETWDGTHDWFFWDKSIKKALEKYYPMN